MAGKKHNVTLIPGDWIGPETARVVQDVIEAAGVDIAWDEQPCGAGPLSPAILESCRRNKVILKAKVDAKRAPGHLPPTVQLRKELGLWATLRPVQTLPGIKARFHNVDVLVVRETSEDIYAGFEHEVTSGVFEAVKVTTAPACERIARWAFELARQRGRKKVTIVHKSNIMKKSDGMFLRIAQETGQQYPDIQTEEVIVDALCMKLVRNPGQFDVLLTPNLYGDIVSDLCSGLAGGLMASPSASFGDASPGQSSGQIAMFENPHGRAKDLVGTGRANPLPMLRAAVMMLEHIGEAEAAARIDISMRAALGGGLRTIDQGGTDGLDKVRDAVIAGLDTP